MRDERRAQREVNCGNCETVTVTVPVDGRRPTRAGWKRACVQVRPPGHRGRIGVRSPFVRLSAVCDLRLYMVGTRVRKRSLFLSVCPFRPGE